MNYLVFATFSVSAVFFIACSSPESDGIKAAQKLCDCVDDVSVNAKKAYETYIRNFSSYSFKTRIEAREKLSESRQQVEETLKECQKNAEAYRGELAVKYSTNKEKVDKFQYAYNAHQNAFRPKDPFNEYDYSNKIQSLTLSIIPPKPDVEQLKKDMYMVPNSVYQKDSYYIDYNLNAQGIRVQHAAYSRPIRLEEIKEVKILNTTDSGDEYLLLVYLRLSRGSQNFDGNVNVSYILGNYDFWVLQKIETEN